METKRRLLTKDEVLELVYKHELWNKGDKENGERIDLHQVIIRELDLTGRNLTCASIRDSVIEKVKLNEATLRGIELKYSKLNGCRFVDADISNGQLLFMHIEGCDFSNSELKKARMRNTEFKYCTFDRALMHEVDLNYTKLFDCWFNNAMLNFAQMNHTTIKNTSFEDAKLLGVERANTNYETGDKDLYQHIDDRQAISRLYYLLRNVQHSMYTESRVRKTLLTPQMVKLANASEDARLYGKIFLK